MSVGAAKTDVVDCTWFLLCHTILLLHCAFLCPSFGTKVRAALLIGVVEVWLVDGKNLGVVFFFFFHFWGLAWGPAPSPKNATWIFICNNHLGFLIWGTLDFEEWMKRLQK